MHSTSFLAIAFRFAVTAAVSLGTIWLSLGRMAAEKIATTLAMPVGILWLLLLLFAAYAVAIRQRAAAMLLLLSWGLLTLMGNGYLSDQLALSLERPFLTFKPFESKPFDVVIVLGGAGGLGANGRLQGNGSADRLVLAAELYHRKLATRLICTGRRIESMDSTGVDPADVSTTILTGLGVPADVISQGSGRNTSEEMSLLAEELSDPNLRVGLVTSAWHMPRALRLAERSGLRVESLPADFHSAPQVQPMTTGELIQSMIPAAGAMANNSMFLKEYLGMLAGR